MPLHDTDGCNEERKHLMGWATPHIQRLAAGETVTFRPRGHSMTGIVNNGQTVTVAPLPADAIIGKGDVVLCKVRGREYLHLVKAVGKGQYQIGNNRGGINGWTSRAQIYGRLVSVVD